jgi:benzodiazapine receptor
MNRDTMRQTVNVLGTLLVLVVNGLANALPLNGQNTGAISDKFKVFFVPAGYVFAIWGVIYIGLIAFAVYQALPSQRANPFLRHVGYWYALSCLANSAWIFLWHYEVFVVTLVAMFTLLASLIVIYLRLGIGRYRFHGIGQWAVQVPFSIYLGWITVATIANVSDVLYYVNWNGFGIAPEVWAALMIYVAGILTMVVAAVRSDAAFALVIAWAAAGIAVKQATTPLVAINAWILTVVAALAVVWSLYARIRAGARARAKQ